MIHKSIEFGKIDNIVLFGGSWLTAKFIQVLIDSNIKVTLFTSLRHFEGIVSSDGLTLSQITEKLDIVVFTSNDINKDSRLKEFVSDSTLGIAIGAAWIFETNIVELFGGKLLDFMGIDLPHFRGGAHYSWKILAENRTGACNLQLIHGGAESFHKGEIIKRSKYTFPKSARVPQDYFHYALKEEISFLLSFLLEVDKEVVFPMKTLDELQSSYFPFLNTNIQGWIDWKWSAKEIYRFICAFDSPYAGASTLLSGKRVFLKKCSYIEDDFNFHPFHSGLIYRVANGKVFVFARGGTLIIEKVDYENSVESRLTLEGARFYTSNSKLESALCDEVTYESRGLEVKKHIC